MIAKNREYDVAIVGGGIGGLMSAYEIIKQKPHLKVILFGIVEARNLWCGCLFRWKI